MPGAAKSGRCRGPVWLNGRATMTLDAVFGRLAQRELFLREFAERVGTVRRQQIVFAQGRRGRGVHRGGSGDENSGLDRPLCAAHRAGSAWLVRCWPAAGPCSARTPRHATRRRSGRRRDGRIVATSWRTLSRSSRSIFVQRGEIARSRAGGSDRAQPMMSPEPAKLLERWLPAKPAAPVTRIGRLDTPKTADAVQPPYCVS